MAIDEGYYGITRVMPSGKVRQGRGQAVVVSGGEHRQRRRVGCIEMHPERTLGHCERFKSMARA